MPTTTVIDPAKANGQASVGTTTEEQKALRALIERRHPMYDESIEHWNFLQATYDGGRAWFKENLHRYHKEGDKDFEDRLERAYRFNHTREVVDLVNKYLFKQHVYRSDDAPESVKAFWKSCTKAGLGIDEFMRQVSSRSSTLGRVGIVVDSNMPSGMNLSQAEAKRQGFKTYAYTITTTQMLDFAFDEHGQLRWILIHEVFRDDETPQSSGKLVDRYRLWTTTEWKLYEERVEGRKKVIVLVEEGVHNLGRVPVIFANSFVTDEEYAPPSLINDIAYLDKAVANYLSNLDAIIQDQTFSQLVMPAQNVLPGEDDYVKIQEMGSKRVFLFDGEGGGKPEYISPDPKQAQIILETINKIIGEIYHSVGLAGERTKQDNSMGIDNSSGVAKAYDFERVNALLASKADALELVENQLVELVCLWNKTAAPEKSMVEYPDDFDTRGLYDEFDIAGKLLLIEAPQSLRQEQMKLVVKKLFPQLAEKKLKEIESEIEEWGEIEDGADGEAAVRVGQPSRQGQNVGQESA
jgi:hypothetical protein